MEILFCTDKTESIEWQDLVPRQRTSDCLWIHLPHPTDSCTSLLVASSSLRSNTESEDELDAALFPETRCASGPNDSCGSLVEDELHPELTDYPGTTRGTKLSVLQTMLFPFSVNRGF